MYVLYVYKHIKRCNNMFVYIVYIYKVDVAMSQLCTRSPGPFFNLGARLVFSGPRPLLGPILDRSTKDLGRPVVQSRLSWRCGV